MKHETYNQPLDRTEEITHLHEKSRNWRSIGKVAVPILVASAALWNSHEDSQPSEASQTEITHTVESGETVQDILKNVCSTTSEADLLALQGEVGIDIKATNPANPQISAGETFTVTVPTELCHPDQS